MAVSLSEYLQEIQDLTTKNYEILKALNDSFYTKSEHLSVNINNTNYQIPSFIHLENKLNTLEDNFENLVNAPKTGEAVFDFNNNTQSIEVKGFTNVPKTAFDGADVNNIAKNLTSFSSKKNEIFKDFLTPTPYIKIDLSTLPDDIQQVNLKKIVIKNDQLLSLLKTAGNWQTANADTGVAESKCVSIKYSDVVKKMYSFTDSDYTEYEKVYTLPLRYELGTGQYKIQKIEDNWTDDNFIEHYKIQLDKLTYTIADDTIERSLFVGDHLVTNNDKIKLKIEDIYSSTNTVQVEVEQGGFADLCTVDDENIDLSMLKFFADGNIQKMKYLQVPLEEDQYIMVFIAPIQRNSLVQSAWSTGLLLNVYALEKDGQTFEEYYNSQVTNVGDKLFGLVDMAGKDFVNLSETEFNNLTSAKPVIDTDKLKVTLINKHLNNSETISEIYNLYKQKEEYKNEINSVQKQIDEINSLLSNVSFENSSTTRSAYTDQLSTLKEKKNTLLKNVTNCIQQITIASTDTDTPVENPKYHIRGFFDYKQFLTDNGLDKYDIVKLDVQYRYKNTNKTTGNAETLGGGIYSDWNIMDSFVNERTPAYNHGKFLYNLPDDTTNENIPSFNQIDIPISQGETVDIRIRVVYFIGYPFVKTTSAWSEIVNIEFPTEYKTNVTVLDIIEENNDDVRKEAFRNYLDTNGVITHIDDTLTDQNITYFHQPEHIASGFYTDERRVIPLKDKLQTLNDTITKLNDEVFGIYSENITVSLADDENEVVINPNAENTFILKNYLSANKTTSSSSEQYDMAEAILKLKIANNSSSHILKLYSMFPGNYESVVTNKRQHRFNLKDYTQNGTSAPCAWLYIDSLDKQDDKKNKIYISPQFYNQWIYFRVTDPYDGTYYYNHGDESVAIANQPAQLYSGEYNVGYSNNYDISNDQQKLINPQFINKHYYGGLIIYPFVSDIKEICISNDDENNTYKTIKPGEALQLNVIARYALTKSRTNITHTLCFDLRNSLYSDPINYKVKITANYSSTLKNNIRKTTKTRFTPKIIN